GASFKSSDGCNTCTCTEGEVACTEKACLPKVCGGFASTSCPDSQYCKTEAHCGSGDQTGLCTSIPQTCDSEYAPVCGCDNKTYPNVCSAASAGVSVQSKGKCKNTPDKTCGGLRGLTCEKDQYCKYGTHCGATDQTGICLPRPQACTRKYAPVCGCDNKTYPNACNAASAGISVKFKGECKSTPKTCTYNGKTYKDGETFPAGDGCNKCTCTQGRAACTKIACPTKRCAGTTNLQCPKDMFCYADWHCGFKEGQCQTKPSSCPKDVKVPVCGCNNKTYPNKCLAYAAGVSIKAGGECKSAPKTCTFRNKTYQQGQSFNYNTTTSCYHCTCDQGRVRCARINCPVARCGSRGLKPCPDNQFCLQDVHCGRTDRPGICRPKPTVCPAVIQPVCGCDNKNYGNACIANTKGISVLHEGTCKTKTCTYNGKTYKEGESFTAADGCNKCT
ncbi:MAG: Kazal-type serine protease inhibitor domain-containing protein, partial [Myxococcota bacterium]